MTRAVRRFFAAILFAVAAGGASSAEVRGQSVIKSPKSSKTTQNEPARPTGPTGRTSNTSTPAGERAISPSSENNCDDPFTQAHAQDMRKTLAQAAEYRPGLRSYYVEDYNDRRNEYLRAAISPARRKEWYEGRNVDDARRACFETLFDQIADAAKKTLPSYRPTGYAVGTRAELRILRTGVNDLAQATVFKVGLEGPDWRISKDNYNFPTARFKYGLIWARYPTIDDGFCRIIWVNLMQDYAGGGRYGASYANFIKSEPAGCPPGK